MKRSPEDTTIPQRLKQLPDSPGVYLMKDTSGMILYIGKARNLRKRVSSYFQKHDHDIKTKTLVRLIDDIDFFVTETEIEALLLEDSLIKKHTPRFNIRLKDDKKYPYIAVTLSENYPRVIFTRQIGNPSDRYFGPYTDAKAARNTIQLINRIFRLKTCTKNLPLKENERPCLNYQIKRCSGICQNRIPQEQYRELVDAAIRFLEGNSAPVIADLTAQMHRLAEEMHFERAGEIRDIIYDIQQISEKQHVSTGENYDSDYIALDVFHDEAILLLFEFRSGALIGKKIQLYENSSYADKGSIIQTFLIQHYADTALPHIIVTQYQLAETQLIAQHLSRTSGRQVKIRTAKSAQERSTLSLLQRNIDTIISEKMALEKYSDRNSFLIELKSQLSLPAVPVHMVCFDISNFQGTDAVASMASFKYGDPDKENYRRFKIRGYDAADDPRMIHEGVARFLSHVVNGEWETPDLIVIDGGPTQLHKAVEARDAFGLTMPVIAIAKKHEELFTEHRQEPYRLPHESQELKIIQRLRDATHDFGVSYHRKLRNGKTLHSALDDIPGIGPAKRTALLNHFGSVEKIKGATVEELTALQKISASDAQKITDYFTAAT